MGGGNNKELGIPADMQGVVFTVHDLPCDTGSGAELFRRPVGIRARCRGARAGSRNHRVRPYPQPAPVTPPARRAERDDGCKIFLPYPHRITTHATNSLPTF